MQTYLIATFIFFAAMAPAGAGACDSAEGLRLFRAGEHERAITALAPCAGTGDGDAAFLTGRAHFRRERYDEAAAWFEKAVAAGASSDRLAWLGRAYGQMAGQAGLLSKFSLARKARAAIERAVATDAKNVMAQDDLFTYFLNAPGVVGGGTDKARAQAEVITRLDPARGAVARGRLLEHDKKDAEAERAYASAVAQHPASVEAALALGNLYVRKQRWADAHTLFEKALASTPGDARLWYQVGRIASLSKQNLVRGEECLRKAMSLPEVEDGAGYAVIRYRLGTVLEAQGRREEARAEYRAALGYNPSYKPALDAVTK